MRLMTFGASIGAAGNSGRNTGSVVKKLDDAFEKYRKAHFGAYAAYPVEAYTYFAVGWKAAMEAACDVANQERGKLKNGGAINACKAIVAELSR